MGTVRIMTLILFYRFLIIYIYMIVGTWEQKSFLPYTNANNL